MQYMELLFGISNYKTSLVWAFMFLKVYIAKFNDQYIYNIRLVLIVNKKYTIV